MPYLLLAAFLLSYANAPATLTSGEQVESGRATTIHIGWVDISPDHWMPLGYTAKEEWMNLVNGGNEIFQANCRRLLKGYEVVGAKDGLEGFEGGQGLQVRFTDVLFDVDSYALYAAISIVDSKTGTELVRIPKDRFRGGRFSVSSCLSGDFEKLAERVAKVVRQLEKKAR